MHAIQAASSFCTEPQSFFVSNLHDCLSGQIPSGAGAGGGGGGNTGQLFGGSVHLAHA
jgi:hypothetical protein